MQSESARASIAMIEVQQRFKHFKLVEWLGTAAKMKSQFVIGNLQAMATKTRTVEVLNHLHSLGHFLK